jgi:2-phospho-L-lactate transferase/gluconeogenesis factor (CofD/UPF0052 family)
LLAGGTGGAKLATALLPKLPSGQLTVIANTADDDEFWGHLVSPDVDAVIYRLAGVFNEASGYASRRGFGSATRTSQRTCCGRKCWDAVAH